MQTEANPVPVKRDIRIQILDVILSDLFNDINEKDKVIVQLNQKLEEKLSSGESI